MPATFTVHDLRRILREGSGETEGLDGEIDDLDFEALGYESLALLETTGRIKREYGVDLDDDAVIAATTPRALIALVNDQLRDLIQRG
ncbi:acyl carrier protein [Nocardia sp. NPDC057227]|uniref:acyl carrier protein n=1 Tax=Nocardia sp. NPDC057227 TaxID=3346056 RepID=UPI00363F25E1